MRTLLILLVVLAVTAVACTDTPTEPVDLDPVTVDAPVFAKPPPVIHVDVDIKSIRAKKLPGWHPQAGAPVLSFGIQNMSVVPCPDATVRVELGAFDVTGATLAADWVNLCDEPGGGFVKYEWELTHAGLETMTYAVASFVDADPDSDWASAAF